MTTQDVIAKYDQYVMNTYARTPLVIVKAKGSRVWDIDHREYLDLFPGWGVGGVGHCHPWVMNALRGQSTKLAHVPNNYYHVMQWRLAQRLAQAAFDGKVFFANSGAEMVESAIKLARRWGHADDRAGTVHAGEAERPRARHSAAAPMAAAPEVSPATGPATGRYEIIVMDRSFHGRTTGAMSATGQPKYQEGFGPLLPGFVCVPFNDLEAVARAVTPKTAAILLEPIQGEGGIRVASEAFLHGVRQLADQHQLLVIYDEVQTGMGRTGQWFAYQLTGVEPDAMLLAKTLGGGFPIGAILAKRAIADVLEPGTHASTFGGSPLACACGLAVFEAIEKQDLLARTRQLSAVVFERLNALKARCPIIREVRGAGFMIGIDLTVDGRPVVDACRQKRVLINCTQQTVLRLLPAMTITRKELDRGMDVLEEVLMAHAGRT